MIHDELRLSLGALLVGSLAEDESAQVRAHLAACDDCRAAYDEIAGLVGLLATVSAAEAETGPPQADEDMFARLLESVQADRRRQRVRRIGLGIAAAAAAAAVSAGLVFVADNGSADVADPPHTGTVSTPVSETLEATDATTGVWAEIGLQSTPWGTAVTLDLRGVEPGYTCSLVAVAADGTRDVAASWAVPAAGTPGADAGQLSITGTTGMAVSSIARFEVVEIDGTTLVSVPASQA